MLFLLCAFPYISVVATPFDTQPYALISALLALLLLFASREQVLVPKYLLPFGFILIYSMFVWLIDPDPRSGLRSLVGYVSVFVISVAAFLTFRDVRGRHLVFAVRAWLVFGIVQLVIDKHFGSFFLARLSTSNTRGITSLAVEPSFYAVVCIYFLILNDIFLAIKSYSTRTYRSVFVMVVLQIFLARSGLGIILFFAYLAAKFLSESNATRVFRGVAILASSLAVFVVAFKFIPSLQETRVGGQLDAALRDPLLLLLSDTSIADRLSHVLVSHSALFHGHLLGCGLGNWEQYATDLAQSTGGLAYQLSTVNMSIRGRIMSGWGTVLFELGIVGFVFLAAFAYIMYRGWKSVDGSLKRVYFSSSITIYLVMLMAVPISFPLFGYLIGVFVYLQLRERNTVSVDSETWGAARFPARVHRLATLTSQPRDEAGLVRVGLDCARRT
jgi:hypothetical protein